MKGIKVFLMCTLFLLTLAGCGGTSNGTTESAANTQKENSSTTSNQNEGTSSTTNTEDEKKFDLQGATIKIGQWWDGADPRDVPEEERSIGVEESIKKLEEVEAKYNAKIEYVTFADYGKYVENFTTTSLAGEPFADIVVLELFWAFPQLAKKGFIAPLDDYLDLSDSKYNAWMKSGGSFNGKQYGFYDGVPSPYGFFYNKTMVEEMGLEDPFELQQKGEWTWEKFRELAKKATKDTNGDGKIDVYGIAGAYGKVNYMGEQFIYSNKGSVDRDESGEMKFSMDSKNSIEALQFLSDLYNVDKSIMQPVPDDAAKEFVAGKGLMYGGFNWEMGGLMEKMPGKTLGYVFFPKAPQADDYMSFTPFGNMYMVSKYSKNAEAAAHILDEISLFGRGEEIALQSLEEKMPTKDIFETRKLMRQKIDYSGGYYALPDSGKLFESVIDAIIKDKASPATAVEKVKPQFEASLNKLLQDRK